MNKYLIVFERTSTGYSAYCPDLPGCIATGSTSTEVEKNMQEVIAFHLEGLREEKQFIPSNESYSKYLQAA